MKLYSAFKANNLKRLAIAFNDKSATSELFEAYQLWLFNAIYVSYNACPTLLSELSLPINNEGLYNFDEYNLIDLRIIKAINKLSEDKILKVDKDFIKYLKTLGWNFTSVHIDNNCLVAKIDWIGVKTN